MNHQIHVEHLAFFSLKNKNKNSDPATIVLDNLRIKFYSKYCCPWSCKTGIITNIKTQN